MLEVGDRVKWAMRHRNKKWALANCALRGTVTKIGVVGAIDCDAVIVHDDNGIDHDSFGYIWDKVEE